ncbi:MAG: hypothetical protein SOV28_01310, partial [Bacteroidaceae bacterium]|nr:hypothetical protein [Paraprevotella sp.]MDY2715278.1 hypothetical protein [Bacteroidaceae bacterium]
IAAKWSTKIVKPHFHAPSIKESSFHAMIPSFHAMIPSFHAMIPSFHGMIPSFQRDKSAKVIGYNDEVIRPRE